MPEYPKNALFSAKYWVYSGLVVFILGTGTLLVTRALFYKYHPGYFENTIPSISKTAAFPPGSYFFSTCMVIVCINIFILCCMIFMTNRDKIRKVNVIGNDRLFCYLMNNLALLSFMVAAASLLSLSLISLEHDSGIHINLSRYFFIAITMAFIFDTLCRSKLHSMENGGSMESASFYVRYAICFLTILDAVFFQFMFTYKDAGIFEDRYFAQQLYITSEYILAIMAFSYAGACFPDIYTHYMEPDKGTVCHEADEN